MSGKHRDLEFQRNRKIVRAQVHRDWRNGTDVHCWRRGCLIEPGQPFDVGHMNPNAGHELSNLAPECTRCNRSDGGRRGAAITNTRRGSTSHRQTTRSTKTEGLAPW